MNDDRKKIIKDHEIDFKALFRLLSNDSKIIINIIFFITIIGVFYSLLATPLYKSKITMYPSGEKNNYQLGQLQGMATSLGLNMGNESSSFNILDIVNSRRIKKRLVNNTWSSINHNNSVNLIQYWGIDKNQFSLNPINWIKMIYSVLESQFNSSLDRNDSIKMLKWEEEAINKLNERLSVSESKTGLISIKILMEEPQLAADIVNKIHPLILEFTIEEYLKSAKTERKFIGDRQKEVEVQLIDAEDALKNFREKNRNILNSPQLQLEKERLIREVEIKTQVYITLQQQNELAQINEVKETPSVIILDQGIAPSNKDQPRRKLIVIVCAFFGGFIAVVFSIINNLYRVNKNVK